VNNSSTTSSPFTSALAGRPRATLLMSSEVFNNTYSVTIFNDIFYPNRYSNNRPLNSWPLNNQPLNNQLPRLPIVKLSADKQKDHVDKTHDNDFVVLPISPPIDLPLPPPEPPQKGHHHKNTTPKPHANAVTAQCCQTSRGCPTTVSDWSLPLSSPSPSGNLGLTNPLSNRQANVVAHHAHH